MTMPALAAGGGGPDVPAFAPGMALSLSTARKCSMKSSHMKARLLGIWVGVLLGPLWMPVAAHAQDVVHVSDAKFRQLLERQEIVRERQAQSGSGDSQDEREPPVSPSPPPVSENEQSATKSTPAREGGNAPPVEEEKNSVAPPV